MDKCLFISSYICVVIFVTLRSSFISFDLMRVAECVELLSNLYYLEETNKKKLPTLQFTNPAHV